MPVRPRDDRVQGWRGRNTCLTAPQVVALRRIHEGPRDVHEGGRSFPGFPPGAEAGDGGWTLLDHRAGTGQELVGDVRHGFSHMVYGAQGWDVSKAALESDLHAAKEKTSAALDATIPIFAGFARGAAS